MPPARQPARRGIGDGELFIASDVLAVVARSGVIYLDDGELAVLSAAECG